MRVPNRGGRTITCRGVINDPAQSFVPTHALARVLANIISTSFVFGTVRIHDTLRSTAGGIGVAVVIMYTYTRPNTIPFCTDSIYSTRRGIANIPRTYNSNWNINIACGQKLSYIPGDILVFAGSVEPYLELDCSRRMDLRRTSPYRSTWVGGFERSTPH